MIPHLPSPNIAIEVPNLRPKKPKVAIIDTTGSFPLPLLVNVLKLRILEYLSVNRAGLDRRGENAAEEAVQLCLEMVTISRVFDVAGLQEVLSEIERGDQPSHNYDIATPEQLMRSAEIFDSQEESLSPAATSPRRSPSVGDGGIEVIIVDNMTQIINELFSRRDKPNGWSPSKSQIWQILINIMSSTGPPHMSLHVYPHPIQKTKYIDASPQLRRRY